MTASSEAGSLRRIRPDVPLRDIDDDHDLVDHDRQTEHMAPTFDGNIDIFTSCRDGSVHAEMLGARHARATRFRHLSIGTIWIKRNHYS